VVVHDLDIRSVRIEPSKADTPLIVDPNAHLSCPIPLEDFEPIAGRIAKIFNRRRGIDLAQSSKRSILNVSGKPAAPLTLPDALGLLAPERSNHPLLCPDMQYVSRARPATTFPAGFSELLA
jgi:hypothetical protein